MSERQQARLAELIRRFPGLAEQHWCKERLRDLYRAPDRRTAEAAWTSLLIVMEASDDAAVWAWARTLRHWRREIIDLFRTYLVQHESGLRVLAGPLTPALESLPSAEVVATLVETMLVAFQVVIIDGGRWSTTGSSGCWSGLTT